MAWSPAVGSVTGGQIALCYSDHYVPLPNNLDCGGYIDACSMMGDGCPYDGESACAMNGAAQCFLAPTSEVMPGPTGFKGATSSGTVATPAELGISAEGVAEVFAWGFGAVLFLWFLGYCVGAGLRAIRLL